MDINIVYNKIIKKLEDSNNLDIISNLEAASAGAATGSEGLVLTGGYLFDLKYNNPGVYELLKEQIVEYLKYCKQHGIIIK
jgi:hypothetical protein